MYHPYPLLLLIAVCTTASSTTVPVRQYVPGLRTPATGQNLVTELDNKWINSSVTLASDRRTALIMIDVWDDHTLPSIFENQNLRLLPLLAYARSQQ